MTCVIQRVWWSLGQGIRELFWRVISWNLCLTKGKNLIATVYPKKYAHGFCFAVLCCVYTLTDFPISIRLTSLALWQSIDCPSASKATLVNMDKYFMWIHYERLHNHNKAKHNKTVCIFLGIYCTLGMVYTKKDINTVQSSLDLSPDWNKKCGLWLSKLHSLFYLWANFSFNRLYQLNYLQNIHMLQMAPWNSCGNTCQT